MAYMNQEKKKKIAANLKQVMPKNWKYSLAVDNYSTIVLTIKQADIDLIKEVIETNKSLNPYNGWAVELKETPKKLSLNPYYLDRQFTGKTLQIFQQIEASLNNGSHDNSDAMTDYFDVGWYTSINLGTYDKPFICTKEA